MKEQKADGCLVYEDVEHRILSVILFFFRSSSSLCVRDIVDAAGWRIGTEADRGRRQDGHYVQVRYGRTCKR